mmetsp:Transcript_35620/g.83302  ORF Transcript_35620/g.83302 Transcript_35620/m.83302 type:complete len:445 (+) Transcript_35620:138-1472(+)|eukprot:CAMPEP_0178392272 /NCGR_PEP_ID=MMETSP0689_2-20121128/11595_1 /TAXON_ID=160604 /ORGANISM="Amphidinium massartii, Strain CS-259" /LENGTH=444 /DNA_ID=CAMNT_0020012845 /DNA_START=52 /DNA_END=1386 /DNA_ORIENTATION=+
MFDPYGPPPPGYYPGPPPPAYGYAYGPPPFDPYGPPPPVDPYGQPVGYDAYGRPFVVVPGMPPPVMDPRLLEKHSRRKHGKKRHRSDADSADEAGGRHGDGDKQGKSKRSKNKERADPGCNIYVYYVPSTWDSEALKKCFAHYGEVVSCTVIKKESGESKGFGFVGFDSVEAARTAILGMDGFPTEEGKFLSVRPKKGEEDMIVPENHLYPRAGRVDVGPSGGRAPAGANIYVYNLPTDWDEGHFYRHFIHYGQITSITIMRKEDTGDSRGFGFIGFEQPSSAVRAVKGMNGYEATAGKPLLVSIKKGEEEAAEVFMKLLLLTDAMQKEDVSEEKLVQLAEKPLIQQGMQSTKSSLQGVPPDANLFVLHIPEQWNDDDLRRYFDPFGRILSIAIVRTSDGASKGYGFVGYARPSEAAEAIRCMNGTKVGKNSLIVKLKEDRGRH